MKISKIVCLSGVIVSFVGSTLASCSLGVIIWVQMLAAALMFAGKGFGSK